MKFTVTYRGADGARREETIDAASRAECMARCRERGISPLSVREGAMPRQAGGGARPGKRVWLVILGLGIILAILGIIGYLTFWAAGRGDAPPPKPRQETPMKARPRPAVVVTNAMPRKAESPTPLPATNAISKYKGVDIVRSTSQTNTDGTVIERIFTADGKSHRITHLPPRVFDNPCDEYLAAILTVPKNAPMAPLPDLSHENLEAQFMEAIKTPIEVSADDPDDVKETKLLVISAREEMAALIKNGYKFHEVLEEQRKIANENLDVRAKVIRELDEIVRSGDRKSAQEYVRKINIALSQMGIEGVKLPASMRNVNEGGKEQQ